MTVAPGAAVQGAELAGMAGTTWRILKARIARDKAFPVIERGANGRVWSFDAAAALDHLIAGIEKQAAGRQAMHRKVARQGGLMRPTAPKEAGGADQPGRDVPAPPPGPDWEGGEGGVDSALDIAAHARALKALAETQMATHKLKELQRGIVPAESHAQVVATILSTMQTETLAIESEIDPENAMPPDVREAVNRALRTVLLRVRSVAERELMALRA